MPIDLENYTQPGKWNRDGQAVFRDWNGHIRIQEERMVLDKVYRVPSNDRGHDLLFMRILDEAGQSHVWMAKEKKYFFGMQPLWKKMEGLSRPAPELARTPTG